MIDLNNCRERIVLTVLGVVVFSFVALLIVLNQRSRINLQTAERTTFAETVKRRSENLRFFFDDRKNDLDDIGVSPSVQAYFLNKDLGMSLRYGLLANMEDVARALKRLVDTRRFGDFGTIYRRIVMIDETGAPLIDIVPESSVFDAIQTKSATLEIPLFRDRPVARVRLEPSSGYVAEIAVDRPLFHKGRFVGQVTAWIDRKSFVARQLAMSNVSAAAIVDEDGFILGNPQAGRMGLSGSPSPKKEIVVIDFPIADTPFRILAAIPEARLFSEGSGTWLVGSLYGLAFLLLLSGVMIWRSGLKRDILQRELREAQKLEAVGQLAGGIAHEINTPAQYIGNNIKFLADAHRDLFELLDQYGILLESARGDEAQAETIATIEAAQDRIDLAFLREEIPVATEQSLFGMAQVSRIVLAMKEFSHPAGRDKTSVDLNRAIENTITISRNEWKHAAKVEFSLDSGLPMVPCHPGEINQVFLNVLVNAAHAVAAAGRTAEEGCIDVSTVRDGNDVVICIRDNGTGISDAIRVKVFNPFFTTKQVGKGTGQGLAIARDIVVNKHGGSIEFETREGKGTTFVIRLPIGVSDTKPLGSWMPPGSNFAEQDNTVGKL
jgi:signal transduction histidine kinase